MDKYLTRMQGQLQRSQLSLRVGALVFVCLVLATATLGQGYLYGQASLATGNNPGGFAVADFNGDGRLDLAVANTSDNTVSIILAKPDGTYDSKVDYAVGNTPLQLVAGDFNSDGKMDLVVVNSVGNTVSVLLGVGDGTMQGQVTYPTGVMPAAITAADFNGDKKTDLAITNQTDGTVSILFGNGDGTFTGQSPALAVGPTPFAIASGDMSGDGKPDLLVLSGSINSAATLSLFRNNGNGTFAAGSTLLTGALGSMAVGEINHDSNLDIAVTEYNTELVDILLGNGNGTFQKQSFVAGGFSTGSPLAITLGDFNHDGNTDLAVPTFSFVGIYLGKGDGTFQSPLGCGIPTSAYPRKLAVGDFNNDGLTDLAAVIQDLDEAVILLGNGDGSFASRTDITLPPSEGLPAALATDLNGDGKQDLAIVQFNQPSQGPIQGFITSLLGNGDGTFQSAVTTATSDIGINGIVWGDFDANGKVDLATASVNADGGVAIFLGNGNGSFGTPISSYTGLSGLNLGPMVMGDFNRDGKSDLVVVSENSSNNTSPMYVLLSKGDGTFKQNLVFNLAYGAVPAVATADFNGDGYLDLVVGIDFQVLIFMGHGDGTFANPVSYDTIYSSANGVAVGDFNGDGKLDVVVGAPGKFLFYAGNGDGTLQTPVFTTNNVTNGVGMTTGDVNEDGHLDLILDGPSGNQSIALGNGDGTFQSPTPFQGTYSARAFAVGDFNSDGSDDLAQFSTSGSFGAAPEILTMWTSAPSVSFTAAALQFASQAVGSASSPLSISLFNVGNAPLALSKIAASGDFEESDACAKTLAVGKGCTIEVTFTPTASGPRTGSLTFNDNASPGTQTLVLTGSATAPPSADFTLAASPGSNTVQAGSTSSYTLTITPQGGFTGTVQITCTGAPSEAICSAATSPVINGADPVTVRINVTTTAASLVPISRYSIRTRTPSGTQLLAAYCLVLLSLFVLVRSSSRFRKTRFAAFVILLLGSIMACGGGSSSGGGGSGNAGTPTGTYTLTITATSGTITHTMPMTLIVN